MSTTLLRAARSIDWAADPEGRRYIERARHAMENGWACELILLTGARDTTPSKVDYASFEDRFWYVRFTQVKDDGTMVGELLPRGNEGMTSYTTRA